jgi:hypothetical protein
MSFIMYSNHRQNITVIMLITFALYSRALLFQSRHTSLFIFTEDFCGFSTHFLGQ